mgnify:CR=1 FL=1
MGRPNHLEQVRKRVKAAEAGSVFIPSDFFDIAEAVKVNTCLNRLVESGELHRMMRGVFTKPRYSELLHANVPAIQHLICRESQRRFRSSGYM